MGEVWFLVVVPVVWMVRVVTLCVLCWVVTVRVAMAVDPIVCVSVVVSIVVSMSLMVRVSVVVWVTLVVLASVWVVVLSSMPVVMQDRLAEMQRRGHHHIRISVHGGAVRLHDRMDCCLGCLLASHVRVIVREVRVIEVSVAINSMVVNCVGSRGAHREVAVVGHMHVRARRTAL